MLRTNKENKNRLTAFVMSEQICLRHYKIEFFCVTVILNMPMFCGQSNISIASWILRKILTSLVPRPDEQRDTISFISSIFFIFFLFFFLNRLPQSLSVPELHLLFMGTRLIERNLIKLRLVRRRETFVTFKMS